MPGVFPLNDFSQPNAHGRLPQDLLTAPFTPPPLAITPPPIPPQALCDTPKQADAAPPPAHGHSPPPSLYISPGPTAPGSSMQVKALLLHFWVQRSN